MTSIAFWGSSLPPPMDSLTPLAKQLYELGQQSKYAAEHWALLGDAERTIRCHQTVASYLNASMLAQSNGL